jgi:hypothetical protein
VKQQFSEICAEGLVEWSAKGSEAVQGVLVEDMEVWLDLRVSCESASLGKIS